MRITSDGYVPDGEVLFALLRPSVLTRDGDELPPGPPVLYVVDMATGEVQRAYELTNKSGARLGDRRLLSNGDMLFLSQGPVLTDIDGKVKWAIPARWVTHHAEILPNGHLLTVSAQRDLIQEWDISTQEVVWEWNIKGSVFGCEYNVEGCFSGAPDFGLKSAFASYDVGPRDWSHINYAQYLPETDTFIASLRNFDTVVEVNRAGDVVWSFGPGLIKQQHTPRVYGDEILVFDNGNHRAALFNRYTQELLWEYTDIFAPTQGDTAILKDGNIKVVDSHSGRVVIVARTGEVLWEMMITRPGFEDPFGDPAPNIYRAHMPEMEGG